LGRKKEKEKRKEFWWKRGEKERAQKGFQPETGCFKRGIRGGPIKKKKKKLKA